MMNSTQIPYYAPSVELPSELPTKESIESSKDVDTTHTMDTIDSIQIPYFAPSVELPSELPTKQSIKSSKDVDTMGTMDTMDSIQIPYYAPSVDLPSELPTKEAIESSNDVLCEQSARKVVGIGSHFVVKYGLQIDLEEGQNMIFVKNMTSVSVPKVYALFKDVESNKNYIIMERISGKVLDSIWTSLDHMQKQAVALQIRAYFIELRKLHSPDGYCSLDCKPLRDHIFYTGYGEESLNFDGPFKTEMEFNNALIKVYSSSESAHVGKSDYYRRAFPSVLSGHPPTFTHGDLQRKNIIVGTDGRITIIDWEFAGWYPSYWEYAHAIFACGRFADDWSKWVDCSLDVYRNEWAWMQLLIVEIWY